MSDIQSSTGSATKTIILHCGAPKTGSTSFQHLLYAEREHVLKAGFWCPDVSRKKRVKDDIRILLADLTREEGDPARRIDHVRKVIAETFAETGAHTLIISNESLLGKPYSSKSARFLPRAEAQIEAIARALEGYDLQVRFFVRDYASFLPSWYVQQVRMGERMDFDGFLDRLDLDAMSWRPVVTALRNAFGADRVEIYDHAEMKSGASRLMAKAFPAVMAALGRRGETIPNKNIAIGRGYVERYRRWNNRVHGLKLSSGARRTLRSFGRRYVLLPFERFSKSEKLAMAEARANPLKVRYAEDIAWILATEARLQPDRGAAE